MNNVNAATTNVADTSFGTCIFNADGSVSLRLTKFACTVRGEYAANGSFSFATERLMLECQPMTPKEGAPVARLTITEVESGVQHRCVLWRNPGKPFGISLDRPLADAVDPFA